MIIEPAPLLSVEDVSFSYPNTEQAVIDGFSLEVKAGSNIGIVGPSGCGKSTLLRLIAGLSEPTAGGVRLFAPPSRHPVTMLFQQDTLLPWRTVEENVGFFFDLNRSLAPASKRERESRCRELLEVVGLSAVGQSYPHQLSGGMKRRVALLAAIASEPALLLLDEPFASVDEPTRIAIHQELLQIIGSRSITMILVTHDLNEAISLCDEVAIISKSPTHVVSVTPTTAAGDKQNLLTLRREPPYLALYSSLWQELTDEITRPVKVRGE